MKGSFRYAVALVLLCALLGIAAPGRATAQEAKKAKAAPKVERPDDAEEEIVKFYREFDPMRIEELDRIKRENPKEAENVIAEWHREMKKLEEIKREAPEEFARVKKERKADNECWEMGKQLREEKDEAKKKEIEDALRKKLGDVLDARLKQQRREIEEVKKHLAELEKRAEKMEKNRDKMIEHKLNRLAGEQDDLEW
ncbi:MAG TPA: hypothetical protein PL033_17040 [Candidatus Brocadiia bacterium]|nr:hypothetical protein [Candidatus Brocadiia bacterium]